MVSFLLSIGVVSDCVATLSLQSLVLMAVPCCPVCSFATLPDSIIPWSNILVGNKTAFSLHVPVPLFMEGNFSRSCGCRQRPVVLVVVLVCALSCGSLFPLRGVASPFLWVGLELV